MKINKGLIILGVAGLALYLISKKKTPAPNDIILTPPGIGDPYRNLYQSQRPTRESYNPGYGGRYP